ncbi:MAG: DUF637 domain-containing protein, partial [Methylocystaceae bacterium]|nr:DUF637 domain-containing protein [Methylocystaceae bacterium]
QDSFEQNIKTKKYTLIVDKKDTVRSTITAGNDLNVGSSLGDVTIRAAKFKSGGSTTFSAPLGTVNLLTNKDLDYRSESTFKQGAFSWSSLNAGHNHETVKHTEIDAGGGLTIISGNDIVVEYRGNDGLDGALKRFAQEPGLAWMADLKNDPAFNVAWKEVIEAHEEWHQESSGVGGPGVTMIALAITAVSMGMDGGMFASLVAGIQNAALQAAVQAGLTTLVTNAAVGLAGTGDIGGTLKYMFSNDALRSLAVTMITAGLTTGILGEINADLTEVNGELVDASGKTVRNAQGQWLDKATGKFTDSALAPTLNEPLRNLQLADQITKIAINVSVSAATQVGINGQETDEAVKASLISNAVNLAGTYIFKGIGDIAGLEKVNIPEGDLRKVLAHAVAGCGLGAASGSSCMAGAIGAGMQELIGGAFDALPNGQKPTVNQQIALSGLISGVAVALAGGSPDEVTTAQNIAHLAMSNNRQLHSLEAKAIKEKAKELAASGKTWKSQDDSEARVLSEGEWEQVLGQAVLARTDSVARANWQEFYKDDAIINKAIQQMIDANPNFDVKVAGETIKFMEQDGKLFLNHALYAENITQFSDVYDNIYKDWTPTGFESLKGDLSPSDFLTIEVLSPIQNGQEISPVDPKASDAVNILAAGLALGEARNSLSQVEGKVDALIAGLDPNDGDKSNLLANLNNRVAAASNKIKAESQALTMSGTLTGASAALTEPLLETMSMLADAAASPFSKTAWNATKARAEGMAYLIKNPSVIIDYYADMNAQIEAATAAGQFQKADHLKTQMTIELASLATGGVALIKGATVLAKIGVSGAIKMVRKTKLADGIEIEVPVKQPEQDFIQIGNSSYTQSSQIELGKTVQLDQNIVTKDGHVIPNGSIVTEADGGINVLFPDGTNITGPTDLVLKDYPANANWYTNWFKDTAQKGTKNPDSDTILLGRYSEDGISYNKVAQENNATYFELDNWDDVTKGLEEDQVWKINRTFLEEQVSQGKKVIFSHDPNSPSPGTFFEREVEFLTEKEFKFKKRDDGLWEAFK